ncbi:MAG: Fic family protein [Actinobacteria bacterium]|nr:Fic family protein [Actinomycetota bacterium]
MEIDRSTHSPIGRLVAINGKHRGREFSHYAYIPSPLPSQLTLETGTWQELAHAALALGRLDGAGGQLPDPGVLTRPAIRREAVSTSALEGTYTTLPQVLQSELFQGEERPDQDVHEVLAYVRAAEAGYEWVKERPVTLNMIKALQGILMQDDPDCAPHEQGDFRQRQNFIGPRDARVEDALFVPPPAELLTESLNQWELWIHDQEIPLLIRVALGHYQFETIHPFVDGNGRIGRLIAVLLLLEEGVLTIPTLNISPYLEEHREAYQSNLRNVSATGDYDPWIRFFLVGLRVQCQRALDKTSRLVALRDDIVARLRERRIRGTAIQVAEDLIGNPILAPSDLSRRYNVTYQAAAYTLGRLVEAGIVESVNYRSNRRLFVARPVLEILNE